jgi:hypothetical protein
MTQPDRTHHERVLHHLDRATAALEAHSKEVIAATQHHLDHNPVTPPARTDDTNDDTTT